MDVKQNSQELGARSQQPEAILRMGKNKCAISLKMRNAALHGDVKFGKR